MKFNLRKPNKGHAHTTENCDILSESSTFQVAQILLQPRASAIRAIGPLIERDGETDRQTDREQRQYHRKKYRSKTAQVQVMHQMTSLLGPINRRHHVQRLANEYSTTTLL
jgi:hypothetical protein